MTSYIWHPFTQSKTASTPLRVRSGNGVMLELDDGRQIMDCISSWWVTIHGHGQPKIAAAIYEQAQKLEQVIFADFTHEPAERLAEKLIQFLPDSLQWVFFSDNGSTAVEVAIKMAIQYWKNLGEACRTKLICFEGAYHGDTVGAMAVGERSLFTQAFNDLLFESTFIPFPHTHLNDMDVERKEQEIIATLEALLSGKAHEYAGILIEPLVQGAGGIRICREEFLQKLEKIARKYDLLLIYDEVMTGFGRTGDWFASRKSNTKPDIICLSKGISGGFLPLAVTVCSDKIYSAFYSDDPTKTFYHGHSYTANPIGCAAALASMELLEETASSFKAMESKHKTNLAKLHDHPQLQNLRVCGTIAAMDIVSKENHGYLNAIGPELKKRFLAKGFLLRPLGNVVYLMPPYCISSEQIDQIYACISEVLDSF